MTPTRSPPLNIQSGHGPTGYWEYVSRPPAAPLRPFIRGDYGGYVERGVPVFRRELPHPCVVCIIDVGPSISVGDAGSERLSTYHGGFVAGVYDGFADTRHAGHQSGIQLTLTLVGARVLLGVPQSLLANRATAVTELLDPDLPERMGPLTWAARFDLLDRTLLGRLCALDLQGQVVAHGIARIEASGGRIDVSRLARELGYSHKHMVRLFREHAGFAPKRLARLVRFDGVVADVRAGRRQSWSELAFRHGFSDQPHLARELKRFSGLTPSELEIAVQPTFGADVHSVQDPLEGVA